LSALIGPIARPSRSSTGGGHSFAKGKGEGSTEAASPTSARGRQHHHPDRIDRRASCGIAAPPSDRVAAGASAGARIAPTGPVGKRLPSSSRRPFSSPSFSLASRHFVWQSVSHGAQRRRRTPPGHSHPDGAVSPLQAHARPGHALSGLGGHARRSRGSPAAHRALPAFYGWWSFAAALALAGAFSHRPPPGGPGRRTVLVAAHAARRAGAGAGPSPPAWCSGWPCRCSRPPRRAGCSCWGAALLRLRRPRGRHIMPRGMKLFGWTVIVVSAAGSAALAALEPAVAGPPTRPRGDGMRVRRAPSGYGAYLYATERRETNA